MTDRVLVALVAGLPGIITAVNQFISARKLERMKRTVDTTSANVNGRMDALLKAHGELQYKQGIEDATRGAPKE